MKNSIYSKFTGEYFIYVASLTFFCIDLGIPIELSLYIYLIFVQIANSLNVLVKRAVLFFLFINILLLTKFLIVHTVFESFEAKPYIFCHLIIGEILMIFSLFSNKIITRRKNNVIVSNSKPEDITSIKRTERDIEQMRKAQLALLNVMEDLRQERDQLNTSRKKISKLNERLEEKIKIRTKDLEEANKELEEFTYIASHDLKSPVLNISSLIQLLKSNPKMAEKDRLEIIDHLDLSCRKAIETIQDVLEVIKMGKDIDYEKHEINLAQEIDLIIKSMHNSIAESKTNISIKVDPDLSIIFNRTQFSSIIQNLISNSIKYRSKNRRSNILISAKFNRKEIILDVEDNGIGIDLNKHKNKLFKMFNRFYTKNDIEGTGVGLFLVKRMIEKNQAKIKLDSEVDKGTTVSLIFPKKIIINTE